MVTTSFDHSRTISPRSWKKPLRIPNSLVRFGIGKAAALKLRSQRNAHSARYWHSWASAAQCLPGVSRLHSMRRQFGFLDLPLPGAGLAQSLSRSPQREVIWLFNIRIMGYWILFKS